MPFNSKDPFSRYISLKYLFIQLLNYWMEFLAQKIQKYFLLIILEQIIN